jgi:hypothetical protein
LTIDELREISAMIQQSPTGLIGLTRALIALTILTAIGVALVVTLFSNSSDAGDLRKTIIAGLISILGTIVGFYFGSRTATEAAEKATKVKEGGTAAPQPIGAPTDLTPTVSGYDVSLTWAPAPGGKATSFNVYRDSLKLTTLPSNTFTYKDSSVAAGTYKYTVRAVDAAGNESPATSVEVRVPA